MARKSGLGPQGHTAIRRAVEESQAPVSFQEPGGSPAATDVTLPDDRDTVPDNSSWLSFDSSRVVEGAYDPGSKRIYVRFQKPYGEGTPWVYEGVPQNVWNNFKRSASPGKFVNRTLNNFNNHRGRWED